MVCCAEFLHSAEFYIDYKCSSVSLFPKSCLSLGNTNTNRICLLMSSAECFRVTKKWNWFCTAHLSLNLTVRKIQLRWSGSITVLIIVLEKESWLYQNPANELLVCPSVHLRSSLFQILEIQLFVYNFSVINSDPTIIVTMSTCGPLWLKLRYFFYIRLKGPNNRQETQLQDR